MQSPNLTYLSVFDLHLLTFDRDLGSGHLSQFFYTRSIFSIQILLLLLCVLITKTTIWKYKQRTKWERRSRAETTKSQAIVSSESHFSTVWDKWSSNVELQLHQNCRNEFKLNLGKYLPQTRPLRPFLYRLCHVIASSYLTFEQMLRFKAPNKHGPKFCSRPQSVK